MADETRDFEQNPVLRGADERIQKDLEDYIARFQEVTGISDHVISKAATGDCGYLLKWRRGERKVTAPKYDTIVAYMDSKIAEIHRQSQAMINKPIDEMGRRRRKRRTDDTSQSALPRREENPAA
jgi:hypothetical protein